MLPDPTLILSTIKAGFEFGIALFKWLSTPEGAAFAKKLSDDAAAWDKAWESVGKGISSLFKGELFK